MAAKDEGIITGPYDGPEEKKEAKLLFVECHKARMEIKSGPHGFITKYLIDNVTVDRDTYHDWLQTLQAYILVNDFDLGRS